jgi:DNA-binding NarL/FixJ family response regulator
MIELIIADDHPLFREALRGVVTRALRDAIIYEADQLTRLYTLIEAHPDADLLLLDLDMPGANGFSALVHLRTLQPQLPVVIVSAHEDPNLMQRALDHGAMGFIPKSADATTLSQALNQVLDGGIWVPDQAYSTQGASGDERSAAAKIKELTPQQFRILQMVAAGQLNKQIAYDLNVSEATVKGHMTAIMRKLGVSNRTQAVLIASKLDFSLHT